MNAMPQNEENTIYKETMFQVIAELFEKTGADNPRYSSNQKATDILEVLTTLLAYTIYNSCPNSETIRDASEATYFQMKQMALAYYYQQQNQESPKNNPVRHSPPGRKF